MDGSMLARLGAIVFVAIAITATVIEFSRKEEQPDPAPTRPAQTNAVNPLQAELLRCQSLGEAGPRDQACLRAWAESRRRFLTPGTANSQSEVGTSRSGDGAPIDAALPNSE